MQKILFLSLLFFLSFFSCETSKTVNVGLTLSLTSPQNERFRERLAVEVAKMAVREINQAGGIRGRKLVLYVKDDRADTIGVYEADSFFLRKKVIAIIGHSFSTTTIKSYLFLKRIKADLILLAPYAASSWLSEKDDFLLRTSISNDYYAEKVNLFLKDKLRVKRMAICSSTENPAYQRDIIEQLLKRTEIKIRVFRWTDRGDLRKYIAKVLEYSPEAVFFVGPDRMTVKVVKELKKNGYTGFLLGSTWPMTPDLLRVGGRFVEGMIFFTFYNPEAETPMYRKLKRKVLKLYSVEPGPVEASAYEAIYVLAEGLKRARRLRAEDLKRALLEIEEIEGVFSKLKFNRYGDVIRPVFAVVVKGGRYRLLSPI